MERARIDALFGHRTPRPAYREPRGPAAVGRVLSAGADPRRWLDLLHGIIAFPVAVATFSIVVSWFAAAVAGLGYVLWEWSVPRGDDNHSRRTSWPRRRPHRRHPGHIGLGAVAAITLPFVIRGCAAVQAGLAWSLLADHCD